MTTIEPPTVTPAWPTWLEGIEPQASIEHARRRLSWTIPHEAKIHGNTFVYAWVEVDEIVPFQPNLHLYASRRRYEGGYARESFTRQAVDKMRAELVPVVEAVGFDRLWIERHRQSQYLGSDFEEQARRARRLADWWTQRAYVVDAYRAGDVTVVPVHNDVIAGRQMTIAIPSRGRNGDTERAGIIAALHGPASQIGWMTDHGELVPMYPTLNP